MAIIEKQVKIAKEVDDVLALVSVLVGSIVEKKELSAIIAESVQPLITAIDGIVDAKGEWDEDKGAVIASVVYRVGEIVNLFLPAK